MAVATSNSEPAATDDLVAAVHDEIARLPEKYRVAVVLCDLEGMTQPHAAGQLRWSERTLRHRLAEGRARLKRRLARRGLAPGDATLGALFLHASHLAVPPAWCDSTVNGALVIIHHAGAIGAVSAGAYTLTQGVIKSMFLQKLPFASAVVLGFGVMVGGGAAVLHAYRDEPAKADSDAAVRTPNARPAVTINPEPNPFDAVGTLMVRGQVLDPNGQPVPKAEIYVRHNVRYGWSSISPNPAGQKGGVAACDADGRFQFELDKGSSDFPYTGDEPSWHKALIAATAPGYGLAWVQAGSLASGSDAALRLARDDVPVHGRVVDTQSRPVAGVNVRLGRVIVLKDGLDGLNLRMIDTSRIAASYGMDDAVWPGGKNVWTTDADGRFEAQGIGTGRMGLFFFHGAGIQDASLNVLVRPNQPGAPANPHKNGARDDTPTDLPGGVKVVDRTGPRVVGPTFELVVGPMQPISGVVRLKGTGKPLAGVPVHGSVPATGVSVSARTDTDGRFHLVGLPKGEAYQIRAYPRTGIDPFLGTTITVTDTEGLKPIETTLELPRGVIVIGRLIDRASRQPVFAGGAQYFKLPTNPHEGGSTQRDGGGRTGHISLTDPAFRLTVPPGGGMFCTSPRGTNTPYTQARLSQADSGKVDYRFASNVSMFNTYKLVDVPDVASPITIDFELTRGHSRSGRVVGPDGKPLPGAQVEGMDATSLSDVTTLKDESFEVVGLEPGTPRQLVFSHRDRRLVGSLLLEGEEANKETPIVVRLAAPGSVKGRLIDEDGLPLAHARLNLITAGALPDTASVFADADGRFQVDGLIPGIKSGIGIVQKPRPNFRLDTGGVLNGLLIKRPGEVRDLGDVLVRELPKQD